MSIHALNWGISKKCPTPTSKLVLIVLCNYADERFSCYPSEKHLANICGISDRSVRRCIKGLSDLGLLDIESRKGTSNRYHLRVDISVQTRVDASVRTVGPRASSYTKDIQKKKTQRRSLNELAG